jgi:TetR/AcrR family transcriptional regulator, transcriptional repressor for nem operon
VARTKEFDPDVALQRAVVAFQTHGYDGISTAQLCDAMQIGRQSLYDTFGDKASLYQQALSRYSADSIAAVAHDLAERPALECLQAVFDALAELEVAEAGRGCLLVNAIGELTGDDHDVSSLLATHQQRISELFADAVTRGQRQRHIPRSINPRAAAAQLMTTFYGLRVMAKVDPSSALVHAVAANATAFLRHS